MVNGSKILLSGGKNGGEIWKNNVVKRWLRVVKIVVASNCGQPTVIGNHFCEFGELLSGSLI